MFFVSTLMRNVSLPSDHAVYAWGNNSMGQAGQGHCNTPVTKPKKILGLDGVQIRQIAAGTSHSVAWTALPSDRFVCLCVCLSTCLWILNYFIVNHCHFEV